VYFIHKDWIIKHHHCICCYVKTHISKKNSFLCNTLNEQEEDNTMSWFKRELKGIITSTEDKKEAPDGIWNKCPNCKKPLHYSEQVENQYVCHYCGYHIRIGSKEYFSILFDNNEFTELNPNLVSGDPLHFTDTKKYADRLKETIKKPA
jgi:acetyl-CoA carboxylase carboxyl transferase subunit beta